MAFFDVLDEAGVGGLPAQEFWVMALGLAMLGSYPRARRFLKRSIGRG